MLEEEFCEGGCLAGYDRNEVNKKLYALKYKVYTVIFTSVNIVNTAVYPYHCLTG